MGKTLFLGVAIISASFFMAPMVSFSYANSGLFGTNERTSTNLAPFPKWNKVMSKISQDESFVEWENVLKAVDGMDRFNKVREVNRIINNRRYVIDPTNWGMSDYWATLREFFYKNGDCEDYAISKFMTLRELGIPNDDMRVVIVQDQNLRIAHAILAVKINGQEYILDNQIKDITPDRNIRHYKPVYSINETNWWLHKR